jgi:hypothetical protein
MISNHLSSGSNQKRSESSKIDITMARVVPRSRASFEDVFTGDFGTDMAPGQSLAERLI